MARNGLARGIEIIQRQRHRAKAAITFCPMVHHIAVADNDIARRDFHTAMPEWRLMVAGQKCNNLAIRLDLAGIDLGELFLKPLHPQFLHADLRQLGTKFAAGRRN